MTYSGMIPLLSEDEASAMEYDESMVVLGVGLLLHLTYKQHRNVTIHCPIPLHSTVSLVSAGTQAS